MKVLLLTLVLGLVFADQAPVDPSQISQEWRTLYVAASNPVKTRENGPFWFFIREYLLDSEKGSIVYLFYVMENGQCVLKSVPATRIHGNVFTTDYAGANLYEIIYKSETSFVSYIINLDDNNDVTYVTLLLGKGNNVNEEEFERYKELTRERNIPVENIKNVIKYDNCPEK